MKTRLLFFSMMFFAWTTVLAQRMITGSVADEKGEGLPGASVSVKGTTIGTITDLDGKFSLSVKPESKILIFSFTGFTTKEVELGASDAMNVTLSEGVSLTEVVVGALGISRDQKSIGHSSQQVSGDAVNGVKETNLLNSLSGRVSGLTISGGSGNLGSSARVLIRGINSITG